MPNPARMEEERERFEEWAKTKWARLTKTVSANRYEAFETECAWFAWQACAALERKEG